MGKLRLAKATDMVDKPKEEERRQKDRRRINTAAWADPGGILPVIDCKIIDFTEDGAKVTAPAGTVLPDVFALQIDNSRILGDAQVIWRAEGAVGVRFLRRA